MRIPASPSPPPPPNSPPAPRTDLIVANRVEEPKHIPPPDFEPVHETDPRVSRRSESPFRILPDGRIHATWSTPSEAKLLLKLAKAARQQLRAQIAAVSAEKRQVSANYRAAKAAAGPSPFPYSRGGVSQAIRAMQFAAKAAISANFEPQIRELETQKAHFQMIDANLQHVIAQIQAWLEINR